MGLLRMRRGEVFADNFAVMKLIAEGGMGMVYAAQDRSRGDAMCALKVLLPELVANEKSRQRFAQEAKVAQRIDHPAIPTIYSVGIDQHTGVPYIAMELLEGTDLRDRIEKGGPLALADARPILLQVCAALAAAHREGIVHRDLKPENVFLENRPGAATRVRLLDFGIIKELDPHQTSARGTGAIGSPMWMAPEQTSAGGRIAPATDCFALGLLAFYVLTGKIYWRAAHEETGISGLLRELHIDDFTPPSVRAVDLAPEVRIPVAFDDFFLKAVARDSKERFRDASDALGPLEIALRTELEGAIGAYAQTVKVHRDELLGRSNTSPMGSSQEDDPTQLTQSDEDDAINTLPARPVRAVPRTSEHERVDFSALPLPSALATTAPVPPGQRPEGPGYAGRIPSTDPPPPPIAPIAHAQTPLSRSDPRLTPPPSNGASLLSSNLLVWMAIACVVGFFVAVVTAFVVWTVLTSLH